MLLDIKGNLTDISASCINMLGIEVKMIEDYIVNVNDIIKNILYIQEFKDTGKVISLNRYNIRNKINKKIHEKE